LPELKAFVLPILFTQLKKPSGSIHAAFPQQNTNQLAGGMRA